MKRTQSALMERLRAEQAAIFINRAAESINAGQPWAAFEKRYPQYGMFPQIRQRRYDEYKAMERRRRQSEEWSIQAELQIAYRRLQAAQDTTRKECEP